MVHRSPALRRALLLAALIGANSSLGAIRPDKVWIAEGKKTERYLSDGLYTGGDRRIDEVAITEIRRATNKGFERIVIDLEGSRKGEPVAIPRPPYYQVAVSPEERRLVFTIWGRPRLDFNAKKVIQAFRKSAVVERVELLPRLEEHSWTFALSLKSGKSVEVFELTNPVRVILDIRK